MSNEVTPLVGVSDEKDNDTYFSQISACIVASSRCHNGTASDKELRMGRGEGRKDPVVTDKK